MIPTHVCKGDYPHYRWMNFSETEKAEVIENLKLVKHGKETEWGQQETFEKRLPRIPDPPSKDEFEPLGKYLREKHDFYKRVAIEADQMKNVTLEKRKRTKTGLDELRNVFEVTSAVTRQRKRLAVENISRHQPSNL